MHALLAQNATYEKPSTHRYGLLFEGKKEWTPKEFWKLCHEGIGRPKLPIQVSLYDVVEIDDGLKPVCFYLSRSGYKIECCFQSSEARKRSVEGKGGTE